MAKPNRRRYFVRQPLTVMDSLFQETMKPEAAHAASRLFHQHELDDVPVSKVLTSLGCIEE